MLIELHLGCRWLDKPIVIRSLVHSQVSEFDPDDVFDAAQRIDIEPADCQRIADLRSTDRGYHSSWAMTLKHIRRQLDRLNAPSMSVGDSIIIKSEPQADHSRRPIVKHTCESMGWSSGPVT